jgi:gas vesicle protein
MASTKKIISGAALGTLLGSVAAFLYPKRYEILERVRHHSADIGELTEKAKKYGESLLNKGKQLNFRRIEYRNNYWKGGLIGLIVGASAGLLVAPRSGKTLRAQITRAFNDLSEKSDEVIHQFKHNSHNPFLTVHTHPNGMKKKKPMLREKKTKKDLHL